MQPTEERAHLLDSLSKGDSLDKLFTLPGPPQHVPRSAYVVGSVPLEELARRYPSPYPGVTYTNGRL